MFSSLLKMVIDFNTIWCKPCKDMDPIIQDYAANYKDVEFIKIDADELLVSYHSLPSTTIFMLDLLQEINIIYKLIIL